MESFEFRYFAPDTGAIEGLVSGVFPQGLRQFTTLLDRARLLPHEPSQRDMQISRSRRNFDCTPHIGVEKRISGVTIALPKPQGFDTMSTTRSVKRGTPAGSRVEPNRRPIPPQSPKTPRGKNESVLSKENRLMPGSSVLHS